MERLTKRPSENEEAYLSCERCGKTGISECWNQENCTQTAVDRLAEIEDILGDDYGLDRLRELVEADREERVVVLPVKEGATVYHISRNPFEDLTPEIFEFPFHITDYYEIGNTVFLTEKDVEAALKGEQDGVH